MPVFNGEDYLAKALDSLLGQTLSDFRAVISDNASTDATKEIALDYAARDDRIVYVRQERNLGASRNYSLLVEISRTPYFKWAAADDLVERTFLQRCVEVLDERPELVGVYARTRRIDQAGRFLDVERERLRTNSVHAHVRFRDVVLKTHTCWSVFGTYRTEVLRQTRLIGPFNGADRALLAELALIGPSYEISDALQYRRIHPGSFSSGHGNDEARVKAFWTTTYNERGSTLRRVYRDVVDGSSLDAGQRWLCHQYLDLGLPLKRAKHRAMRSLVWPAWSVAKSTWSGFGA